MVIRLIGQRNTSGIGTHYAHFCDVIRKMQGIGHLIQEVDCFDQGALILAATQSKDQDINISFAGIDLNRGFRGHNIQWVVFESTRIPSNMLSVCQTSEQVWVPSDWGRSVLITNGILPDKIRVIPEGVDGNKFHTHGRKPYRKDRPFRFLSIGKYEQRKSLDETIDAFAQVYANTPAIELVIKSNYFMNHDVKFQKLQDKVRNLSNVTLLWGEMPDNQLSELYRSCDAFVLPSRAEGWGLPLIEAAASGLPIITTMYSGQTEFLKHIPTSVLSVSYVTQAITCPDYGYCYPDTGNNLGNWVVPDVVSIAGAMQTVCREYEDLFEHACANSFVIRRTFTWHNSVDLAIAALGPIADFRAKSMTYST